MLAINLWVAPRVHAAFFTSNHIGQNSYRRRQNKEVEAREWGGVKVLGGWILLHISVTQRCDCIYMLSVAAWRNGASRRAGAEFDQCDIEGIQILTCHCSSQPTLPPSGLCGKWTLIVQSDPPSAWSWSLSLQWTQTYSRPELHREGKQWSTTQAQIDAGAGLWNPSWQEIPGRTLQREHWN